MKREYERLRSPFSGAFLQYRPMGECRGTILLCPGGAYEWLSPREGLPVAEAFEQAGWQAVVLEYTVDATAPLGTLPLREAAWAVRTVRENPDFSGGPVILCGFSAGGHLAASLGVHWKDAVLFPDPRQRRLQRPDGLILCYPVITAGPFSHKPSIDHLTGGETEQEAYFSLENHVDRETPPTFLWHTASDESVPVENTLLFARALQSAGVPWELHVFPTGKHGLSLATPEVDEPQKGRLSDSHVAGWFRLCCEWLSTCLQQSVFE